MNTPLIPLADNNGVQAVMGRDLHQFLEVKTPYDKWMPRMVEYGFVAGQDFSTKMSESTGGRPSQDHIISLDMAKEISMIQRTDKGKKARQYFIECERQAKEKTNTLTGKELMAAALIEAQATMKELEATTKEQQAQLEAAAPKVAYHDRFISPDSDVFTIDDWAAQYGITKGSGLALLRDKKIIYKKAVTREMSSRKKEQVDRMEHRSYAPYKKYFDLRPQLTAPRYNNGQMRQTLYVKVAASTQLAEQAGIITKGELF
ncbi:antirepressor [Corynebacterium phage PSonyx]|nr:antirepressor [Corynebacterium phage PSonyx]